MQDLLEDFGIRGQRFAGCNSFLERAPSRIAVWMIRAHEVHRDVRVDEDHDMDRSDR